MVGVLGGETSSVKPYIKNGTKLLLKKGESEKLEQVVTLSENVEAPVTENQKLGSVKFILNGKTLSEIPLLASEEVKKLTFYTSFKRIMNFLACGEKI
jgi:D-alanyl-D-alanine carboxypeptidase (penicillin-binding protein 5/6)